MHSRLAVRNIASIASTLSLLATYSVLLGSVIGSDLLAARGLYLLLTILPLEVYTLALIGSSLGRVIGDTRPVLPAMLVTGVSLGILYTPALAAIAERLERIALEARRAGIGVPRCSIARQLIALWPLLSPLLAAQAAGCIEGVINGIDIALLIDTLGEGLSGGVAHGDRGVRGGEA